MNKIIKTIAFGLALSLAWVGVSKAQFVVPPPSALFCWPEEHALAQLYKELGFVRVAKLDETLGLKGEYHIFLNPKTGKGTIFNYAEIKRKDDSGETSMGYCAVGMAFDNWKLFDPKEEKKIINDLLTKEEG